VATDLPTVQGDPFQLSQLVRNLVENAVKFRSERPPELTIAAERRDEEWLFTFRDNGIGIDPRYAIHIFTIFQRLHGRDEYGGTGVGLAISKKIVERHQGRIWVESQQGDGATFNFTLPARLAVVHS
jgi:chemotaxis family two-component system sensor kinase Cph1